MAEIVIIIKNNGALKEIKSYKVFWKWKIKDIPIFTE